MSSPDQCREDETQAIINIAISACILHIASSIACEFPALYQLGLLWRQENNL